MWIGIAAASGLAALVEYVALDGMSPALIAVISAVAADAILAMLADTMSPEPFEKAHALTGLITDSASWRRWSCTLPGAEAGR